MGDIKIGNSSITLKLGSSAVTAAYLGSTLVYSGGTPPTPPSQCMPSSTSIWYQSEGNLISSSTPIYGIDVFDISLLEGSVVLSTTPNGYADYYCEFQIDEDPEGGDNIYTLKLYDVNFVLVGSTVNEPLNLCTVLGFPLYVINDSAHYEDCIMSECISWCADDECSDCTDEEGEYGCCEEECTETIQTYVMCYTIEDNS